MEEGSRRGIYGERIPLCRGVSPGRVEEGTWVAGRSSEQAVRDILEKREQRG